MLDWDEENSAMLVVATMRTVGQNLTQEKAKEVVAKAHDIAAAANTVKQSQYDIAFGNALFNLFVAETGMDRNNALLLLHHKPTPVATETPLTAAKLFATPKKDVYDGPAFSILGFACLPGTLPPPKPKPLEKPDLNAKSVARVEYEPQPLKVGVSRKHAKKNKGKAIIYVAPDRIPPAPWGLPAVELVEWAWRLIEAEDHVKMSVNQMWQCAKILSVLMYADLLPKNSIIPVGMTRKHFAGKQG